MKPLPKSVRNITSYRVIYGDTDRMGVVYYANYLRWFETGRSELLRQMGLPYGEIEDQGFHFPVTEVSCHYTQSAQYDEVVNIETEVAAVGRATLIFNYRITRGLDNAVLATGSTKHACIDRTGRVSRLPKTLESTLKAAQDRSDVNQS
jgi:acyl-CoA thioester hydrolase